MLIALSALAFALPGPPDLVTIAADQQQVIEPGMSPSQVYAATLEAIGEDGTLDLESFDPVNPWPGVSWPNPDLWYPNAPEWPGPDTWYETREAVQAALTDADATARFAGGLAIDGGGQLHLDAAFAENHGANQPLVALTIEGELHEAFRNPLLAIENAEGFVDPLIAFTPPGGTNALDDGLIDMVAFVDPLIAFTPPGGTNAAVGPAGFVDPLIAIDATGLAGYPSPQVSIELGESFTDWTAAAIVVDGQVFRYIDLLEDASGLVVVYE